MPSFNKVIIMGNLGRDPDTRYTPDGKAICSFSMATTRVWKNKDGEKNEDTQWHNIVMFGRLAEIAGEHLLKGDPVFVEGWLRTRKWTDKEGNDKYTTEIVGEALQLLATKRDRGSAQQERKPSAPSQPAKVGDDDDIPF